ncbi:MAG: FAD:protein FMN transferase, partial [Peptoniphilus harei]|uniref:FAD:protein FMN transferase n=1 Tax=Peptoniphilus harei TaxID=54005 RepID=UPI0028FF1B6B
LIQTWRIGFSDARLPLPEEIAPLLQIINPNAIVLSEENQSVFLQEKDMKIDLGALAKGYIADRIADYLKAENVTSALINLGGNVLTFGPALHNPDQKWRIGIQNPKETRDTNLMVLAIRDQSIVTSGIYERTFEINGKKYIFDKFIIEDNNLYTVILSLNDSEKMLSGEVNLTELKVNGKKIKIFGSSGSGYTLPEDEKVNVYTLKYVLEDSLPKEGEVNLEFFFDEFLGNKKKINLSTNIDMSQMQMNKKLIAKDFTIPNTNNIVIESFTTSPASQKILLTYPDIEDGYLYSIKARDSKDRFVYFETGEAEKNKSNLYFSPVTSKVTADELLNEIKTLKCQLYRVTVHSYDNREIPTGEQAIGDEFTLTLK